MTSTMSEKTSEDTTMTNQRPHVPLADLDPEQAERTAHAPLPTRGTLLRRRCVPFQLLKFAEFNLRIMDITLRERLGQ